MSESKPDRDVSHPSSLSATTPEKKPTDATKVSRPKGFVHAIRGFMRPPPWVINNIRQRKSQKLLFRSCLASWAALILLLSDQSLKTIGNLYVQANTFVVCDILRADENDSSLVGFLGYSLLCSSLQDIRYKSTWSYVAFLNGLLPVLTNRARIQLVVQSLLGLLTGWGIGSAAMKAAVSVRSQLVDQATLQNAVNRSASP